MNNIIEYKGYQAVIEYSAEDATLFGKVMDIDDRILFEIEDPSKAEEVFKDVIEDYLEMCKEVSKEPCKPYKGSFNVRISPDLHKKAVQAARRAQISLNAFVESLFEKYLNDNSYAYDDIKDIPIFNNNTGALITKKHISQTFYCSEGSTLNENSNMSYTSEVLKGVKDFEDIRISKGTKSGALEG